MMSLSKESCQKNEERKLVLSIRGCVGVSSDVKIFSENRCDDYRAGKKRMGPLMVSKENKPSTKGDHGYVKGVFGGVWNIP